MAFTGNEDFKTNLSHAADLTKSFRTAFPNQPKGIYISRSTLEEILAQEEAVGIRFYFGLENGSLRLVYCGVEENEDDILNIIGNHGMMCPPYCGKSNALNSNQ